MALRVFGPTLGRFSRVGFRSKTRRIGITDSVLLQLNIVNKLLAEQKKASIGDPFAGDSEFETLITKQINIPKNVETSGLPDIYHSTAKKSNTDNTKNISVNPNNTSENFQTTHNKALQYKKEESVNNVQNLKNITSSVNKVSHLQPLINKKSEVNFNDNTQEETTINNQVNNVSNNIEEVSNNITSDRQEAVQGVINNTQEQEESMHSKRNIVNVVEENVVEENVVEENVVEENVVEENVVEENKQPIINSIASVNAEYSNIKAQPNLHANSVKDVTQTSQQQPPLIKTSPKTNLNVEQILMRLKKARANTDNNLNQVTQGNVEITHNLPNGNLNSNRDAQDNHDSDTDNEIRHNDNTVNVGNDTVVNEKNINPVNTVANPQTSQAFNNAKPTLTNEELAIINKYANKPIAA